jgi:hypothetical protein
VKKIIVFIRGYNDFDQVLPILDYLIRVKNKDVEIYGVGEIYKSCDKHIKYVETILDKKINIFESIFSDDITVKSLLIWRRLNNFISYNNGFFSIFVNLIVASFKKIFIIRPSYLVKRFVKSIPKDTVLMADFGTENIFPYSIILQECHKKSVPIYAYLHGYGIFTNLDPIEEVPVKYPAWIIKFIDYQYGRKSHTYDKYLVGTGQRESYFSSNIYSTFKSKDLFRVHDIGLPRFSHEWIDRFFKNKTNTTLVHKHSNKKLNVVLFLSNSKFKVDAFALDDMAKRLSKFSEINFMIKPHTRSKFSGMHDKQYKVNLTNMDSYELIEWSDVCIIYGTSISLQVLESKKILVIPIFIDKNITIFENNNVCEAVDSLDNLLIFLKSAPVNSKKREDDINDFLQEKVYGGCESYTQLMENFYSIINSK